MVVGDGGAPETAWRYDGLHQVWGISCVSVASGRELPEHKAEMGTQVLMGEVVRVWKRSANAAFPWYLAQSGDGYISWIEEGTFVRCAHEQVEAWHRGAALDCHCP